MRRNYTGLQNNSFIQREFFTLTPLSLTHPLSIPDFGCGLHSWELYGHHAICVGLSHHCWLGLQDVWGSCGSDAVLQTPGTVGPVGEQK